MKRTTKSIITVILALAMLMSFVPASTFAAEKDYMAYLCIQSNNTDWIFRNACDATTFGLGTEEFKGLYSTTTKKAYAGKFTDVAVTADGTYTVALEGPDFSSETTLSQIFVSTSIPVSKDIKITDVKIKVDGSTKYTFDKGILNKESKKYVQIMLQNIWNKDVTDLFAVMLPFNKMEITFTVSGIPAEAAATDTDTDTDADTDTATSDDSSTTSTASTGVVGLGIVYGLGALATGAVALKRKKK